MMNPTFTSHICGIPCVIKVMSYRPGCRAQVYGPPELCYEAEDAEMEYEVFDRTGYRAMWLEEKITMEIHQRLMAEYEEICRDSDG